MTLETGEDAGIDYLWTDFGGAPSGDAPVGINAEWQVRSSNALARSSNALADVDNAEWQCKRDTPPLGIANNGAPIGPATPGAHYTQGSLLQWNVLMSSLSHPCCSYPEQATATSTSALSTRTAARRRRFGRSTSGTLGRL